METQKNDEKNIVLELKHRLGRMMVQIDYMYRNDREMSRLDLDIMMERTRELYDLLCDCQIETAHDSPADEPVENDADDMEMEETDDMDAAAEIVVEEKLVLPVEENNENADAAADEEGEDEEDWEDWEDEDDEMFRVEQGKEEETPAEPEDNSLAARLQHTLVKDIRMVLGINDKVMIINDLFNGSVERYNKSIDALNDFPTLSGARVYMSELQIELQWDTESQSYKMLNDLVERRFL